jgi:hypothetical protein
MRYKLQSLDELHACLGRVPDEIRVEVERGLTLTAETVAELRSLSDLPPGLTLVIHSDPDPRFNLVRLERVTHHDSAMMLAIITAGFCETNVS